MMPAAGAPARRQRSIALSYDSRMRIRYSLVLVLFAIGCASSGPGREDEEARERAAAAAKPNRTLARRIAEIAGGGAAEHFRVRADWSRGDTMTSAEIFGSGAGVWNDRRVFHLSHDEVTAIVRALRDARFASMPNRFGEMENDFLTMRGKVTAAAGDSAKTVVQIDRGPQSDELANLAAGILARAQTAASNGVGATSLADALQKIAAGNIPAEALRITAQQRDDRPGGTEPGFLLQIRGGEAIAQRFDAKKGYGPARRVVLSAAEIATLASLLRASDPASFPQNLYAPMYTDLRIEVLNQSEDRQARPYSGVTAETHGARQSQFDHIIEALRGIAERSLAQGTPAPAIG